MYNSSKNLSFLNEKETIIVSSTATKIKNVIKKIHLTS